MRIKAAVAATAGAPLEIRTLELDGPQADEVLVEVVAAGVCHTDLSVQHSLIPVPLPAVLGHEGAGIVLESGSAVRGLEPGTKVLLSQAFCGHCGSCRAGVPAYCENASTLALGGRREDGSATIRDEKGSPVSGNFVGQSSFATHSLVKARNVVPLSGDAPLEVLAPLGCGVLTGSGAVFHEGGLRPGAQVAVLGCGAVGLSAVMAARIAGARTVIGVDRVPQRLSLAAEVGATHTVDASAVDVAEGIRAITRTGADLVVEAAGVPDLVAAGVGSCTKTGRVVVVGAAPHGSRISLDWWALGAGRTLKGSVIGGSNPPIDLPELVRYWRAGQLPIDKLVTRYPFASVNEAIADLEAGRVLKPVLIMQ